jgi:hypothetical protein
MGVGLLLLRCEECFWSQVVVAVASLRSEVVNAVLLSDPVFRFGHSSTFEEC